MTEHKRELEATEGNISYHDGTCSFVRDRLRVVLCACVSAVCVMATRWHPASFVLLYVVGVTVVCSDWGGKYRKSILL